MRSYIKHTIFSTQRLVHVFFTKDKIIYEIPLAEKLQGMRHTVHIEGENLVVSYIHRVPEKNDT